MPRSFLAAIRAAIFPQPDLAVAENVAMAETAVMPVAQPPSVPAASVPAPPTATHPAVAADHGRFATVAQAEGIAGNPKRLSAALELAAIAPEMSADAIVNWVTTFVPVADAPARTIPTLFERAEEAQRQADALGSSPDKIQKGWGAAIAEAHRLHKIH
jgi:hypothetical protein